MGVLLALILAAVPAVRVGLDVVERENGGALRGRRVGLLAHAASVDAEGRHAIDVLRASGADVRRLFGPEHGLRSRAAAGEKLRDDVDPESGLPVVSLYGAKTKPSPDDLRGLDVLVIDLQDGGVRFYTYVSTALRCLEAAAEAGLPVVVLDRPNPLGGERVEGPEHEAAFAGALLSLAPGPLVHGLTLGEMARLVNERSPRPARLTVVPMTGWTRGMTWADTGRTWVSPSPNLRSPEAALAYPGVCLLEATNVSEGRGTDAPFLRMGAPWVKVRELERAVTSYGFHLEAGSFIPARSVAAPSPKHEGVICNGLRVEAVDVRAARPYAFGLSLLHALRRLHPEFQLTRGGQDLDNLLGTRRVRAALERGDTVEAMLAADAEAIAAFARARKPVLLY